MSGVSRRCGRLANLTFIIPEETFQFLLDRCEELKQFVAATAEQGRGLVVYVG